jgi:hypothetical protein
MTFDSKSYIDLPNGQKSLIEELFESIFTSNLNPRVKVIIHGTFGALTVVLTALFIVSGFNLHVLILTLLSLSLWGLLNW